MKNNLMHKKILILIIFVVIFIVIASAFYGRTYYYEHSKGIPIRMDVNATNSSLIINVFAYRNASNEFSNLGMVGTHDDLYLVYYFHNGTKYCKGFTYNLTNDRESEKIIWNWTFDINGTIIHGPLNGCYKIEQGYWGESTRYPFWDTAPIMVNITKNNIRITGGENLPNPCY